MDDNKKTVFNWRLFISLTIIIVALVLLLTPFNLDPAAGNGSRATSQQTQ